MFPVDFKQFSQLFRERRGYRKSIWKAFFDFHTMDITPQKWDEIFHRLRSSCYLHVEPEKRQLTISYIRYLRWDESKFQALHYDLHWLAANLRGPDAKRAAKAAASADTAIWGRSASEEYGAKKRAGKIKLASERVHPQLIANAADQDCQPQAPDNSLKLESLQGGQWLDPKRWQYGLENRQPHPRGEYVRIFLDAYVAKGWNEAGFEYGFRQVAVHLSPITSDQANVVYNEKYRQPAPVGTNAQASIDGVGLTRFWTIGTLEQDVLDGRYDLDAMEIFQMSPVNDEFRFNGDMIVHFNDFYSGDGSDLNPDKADIVIRALLAHSIGERDTESGRLTLVRQNFRLQRLANRNETDEDAV